MKVLTATNMYPSPDKPYYGTFVRDRVESMRALGVDIDVWFTDPTQARTAYFTAVPGLVRRLRDGRFDLVHAEHTYAVFQVLLARTMALPRAPLLFTIHEAEAYQPAGMADPEADWLKRLTYSVRLKRWALQAADRVVSVDRGLPRAIGYDGPYEVIAPGLDVEAFRPLDRGECRRELGLDGAARVVFFPASPDRSFHKGYTLFRRSLDHLGPELHVVTGGDIPHERMPVYMGAADVVVQTSRFEASPMVVKEAMACNRSVVSTDVGDVRELFGDTPGYFICRPDPSDVAEKIQRALLVDEAMVAGRARIVACGLTLEAVARKYLEVYRSMAGSASRSLAPDERGR